MFHSLDRLSGGVDNRISELEINLPQDLQREYLLFKNQVTLNHIGKINFISSLNIPKFILSNKTKWRYLVYMYGFVNLLFRIYQTRKFLRSNKFTTILAIDDYFALVAILASIGLKSKIITSVRNNWDKLYNGTMIHLLPDFMYKKVLVLLANRYVYKVHCVSKGLANYLYQHYGLLNTMSIYNLFDFDKIKMLAQQQVLDKVNGKYIINIGHFNVQKNQKELVVAYSIMKKFGIEHKLVLIGDGILKDDVVLFVRELGLQDDIIFLGKQHNPYPYLNQASLYMSSSLYEGLPAVFVESMILQVPIVSYDFNFGASELALFVTQPNPNALAREALNILDNEICINKANIYANDILTKEFEKNIIIKTWIEILQ